MKLHRARAFFLAVVFGALARPSGADDTQAAAAAIQAMGQSGAAAGGAPGADARGKRNKDEGGFARPLSAPRIKKTDGVRKRGPAGKNRSPKANESKYKSRELSESVEHVYRFNEKGEPLRAGPKKKVPAKTGKKTSSAAEDNDEKEGDCSSDEPCAAKKTDSDAL